MIRKIILVLVVPVTQQVQIIAKSNMMRSTSKSTMMRLVDRLFIFQLQSIAKKARTRRKCVPCQSSKYMRYWCSRFNKALCLNKCFQVYHNKRDITKKFRRQIWIRIAVLISIAFQLQNIKKNNYQKTK